MGAVNSRVFDMALCICFTPMPMCAMIMHAFIDRTITKVIIDASSVLVATQAMAKASSWLWIG